MKYIIFFLFCLVSVNAQSTNRTLAQDSVKYGLSNEELQKAKEMYALMTKSNTYHLYKEAINDNAIKLGNANYPADLKTSDRKEVEKWLQGNIHDTQYASVEEGIDMITKTSILMNKMYNENIELYTLMRRSNQNEMKVILTPEHKTLDDVIEQSTQH